MFTFRTLLKKRLWQGYTFLVLLSPCFIPSSSFSFYIHPRYTHTPLYFIRPSMLRKYLKNESIGRWLPRIISITIHTCPNWINRPTFNHQSHIFFVDNCSSYRRKIFISSSSSSSSLWIVLPSFFVALPFLCCGQTEKQTRCPQSINPSCKQTTRPYQPPGLIKSNFYYWPTACEKACSLFVFSHNLSSFFSLTARLQNLYIHKLSNRITNGIHSVHRRSSRVSSVRWILKKKIVQYAHASVSRVCRCTRAIEKTVAPWNNSNNQ